ncbi:MAG TPA: hypothetical protein VEB19_11585 [Gemmatimonadaceae bacterium]|nr:hypothetical protein [Gemmatimonadaceae bacterium]
MIATLTLVAALHVPGIDLPSADKVKHFFLSAFIHTTVFSAARGVGLEKPSSQIAAAAATMTIGVLKEVRDRRIGGAFSKADLGWDAFGSLTAAALLNGTR